MRLLALVLALLGAVLGGCGHRDERAPGQASGIFGLGAKPTSPAGVGSEAAATLAERVVQYGRQFRGNPIPLGVLIGAVLLVALGLGIYTIRVAYHPPSDADRR
jgi:hypothetical protein